MVVSVKPPPIYVYTPGPSIESLFGQMSYRPHEYTPAYILHIHIYLRAKTGYHARVVVVFGRFITAARPPENTRATTTDGVDIY